MFRLLSHVAAHALVPAAGCVLVAVVAAAPASAETPRDILLRAAYQASNKAQALALVDQAMRGADAILARAPGDREARMQRAVATGYRAKLMKSLKDAKSAKAQFEALAAANPRDPEPQLALAAWHLETIHQVGSMMASAMLGAKRSVGFAALDRALALGARQALFPGYAAMLRSLDPKELKAAQRLALTALSAPVTNSLDRVAKTNARVLLATLQTGDGAAAESTAEKLLPFGRLTQ